MQTTQRKAESDVGEMDGHGLSLLVFVDELQETLRGAPAPTPINSALIQYVKPMFLDHYEA